MSIWNKIKSWFASIFGSAAKPLPVPQPTPVPAPTPVPQPPQPSPQPVNPPTPQPVPPGARHGAPIAVCPGLVTTHGIDVSHYEASIDWTQLMGSDVKFITIKATEATDNSAKLKLVDQLFAKYWKEAKAMGMMRQAYHFFHPKLDPIAQADLMIKVIEANGGLQDGDLAPVIDIEPADGMTALSAAGADAALVFLQKIESHFGMVPEIYTGVGFFSNVPQPERFFRYSNWLAQYFGEGSRRCPMVPAPWSNWIFWQTSDREAIPGVGKIDSSLFNGSYADLKKRTKGAVFAARRTT